MADNGWDQIWRVPTTALALGDDEVQVWRASLTATPARVAELRQILAADERARAERFRFERDRTRSIISRGVLREIIGRSLGREPGALSFRYNAFGKPSIADEQNQRCIRFNVSHADDVALYAIARHRDVGVDFVRVRTDMARERIAERFFSAREVATLRALDPTHQDAAFFACWTRKEAYKKARGEGISVGLDQFDVSLAPNEPAAILASREAGGSATSWSLHHLVPSPDLIGAVAVQGELHRLTCWQWRERLGVGETLKVAGLS
jgi:4'-phosphopantetheinyl transferase